MAWQETRNTHPASAPYFPATKCTGCTRARCGWGWITETCPHMCAGRCGPNYQFIPHPSTQPVLHTQYYLLGLASVGSHSCHASDMLTEICCL